MNYLSNKSRVLVNVIGIPSILGVVYLGNSMANFPLFSIFILVVAMIGVYEWNNLVGIKNILIKYLNFTSVFLIIISFHMNYSYDYMFLIILGHTFFTITFEILKSYSSPLNDISSSVLGIIWIGVFIGSLIFIRNLPDGFILTLMMILSIWICDTFAFVFGSSYGEKKLRHLLVLIKLG